MYNQLIPFYPIPSRYCWDIKTLKRFESPLYLEQYSYKVFSQNGEDGIINEIFRRIGVTNKVFVEFGVQDGLECNSHYLLFKGWSGLWIEGSPDFYDEIKYKFFSVIKSGHLKISNSFITQENINIILAQNEFWGEIDLLSIDVDGNDYHVFNAISCINPRVVIIEYNGKFPPDCEWVMSYNAEHTWGNNDKHGASLKSYEILGRQKGYQLVGTDITGTNAFFVKEDCAGDLFARPAESEHLYNPMRPDIIYESGHPSHFCLKSETEGMVGVFETLPPESRFISSYGFYPAEYLPNGNFHLQWMKSHIAKIYVKCNKNIPRMALITVGNPAVAMNVTIQIDDLSHQYFDILCSDKYVLEAVLEKNYNKDSIIGVNINVDILWCPAEMFGSNDNRLLGVSILDIGFE